MFREMQTKYEKIVTKYACFSSVAMLTSKIITEIDKTVVNFLDARIAAINLLQFDLDKP